jgi:hypothetical protein
MRYKIVITCPEASTAKKLYELIQNSSLYRSEEVITLNPIREVCDECASRCD